MIVIATLRKRPLVLAAAIVVLVAVGVVVALLRPWGAPGRPRSGT